MSVGEKQGKVFCLFEDTFFFVLLLFFCAGMVLARMTPEARGKLGSVGREGAWIIAALLGEQSTRALGERCAGDVVLFLA